MTQPDGPPPVVSRRVKSQSEQAGILVLGKTAATLADIISPLLIVRLLTKSDVGVLTALLLIFQTTTVIAASGYPRTVLYYLPNRPRAERRAIAWKVARILLAFGAVGGAFLLATGLFGDAITQAAASWAARVFNQPTWAEVDPSEASVHAWLPLLALYPVLDLPARMLPNLLIVEGRARAAAGTALVKSIGETSAILIGALLGVGVGGILAGILTFAAAYLCLFGFYMVRLYRGAPKLDRAPVGFRELTDFSLPLGMTDAVNTLNKGLDRYLVLFFFTAAAFAEYQVGAWQIPVISTIAYSVGSVYLPQFKQLFDEGRHGEAIDIWRASITKVALIVVPVSVAFWVAADDLIAGFFTAEYTNAVPIFRWYTLLTMGRVASYGGPILAAGRTRYIFYASVFTLASNFVVSVPLAATVGFVGPAMGTALAFIPTVAFYGYYTSKATGVPFRRTFPLFDYLKVVAVAVAAGAVGFAAKSVLDVPSALRLVVTVAVVLAAFSAIGTALGLIERSDWRYVGDWLRLRILRDDPAAND
ncbi:MAG: oligosaccharide flippase family protein [Myxococcales bacterium]|nr:oligosaccharide flippase family protein [Myxococcales bacterium]MCB9521482.1 oligosaccharide flippase family protein [Myxococcales bacterium]